MTIRQRNFGLVADQTRTLDAAAQIRPDASPGSDHQRSVTSRDRVNEADLVLPTSSSKTLCN